MTCPDPRYHGQTGEISATYRPSSTAPEITYGARQPVHRTRVVGARSLGDVGSRGVSAEMMLDSARRR